MYKLVLKVKVSKLFFNDKQNRSKILFFDKGGRMERIKLVENKKAPKDFFQGIDLFKSMGFDIEHICSTKKYKNNIIYFFGKIVEEIFSRLTNIGIRPLSVHQFKKYIDSSNYVVSLTDGFSLSLGFYYSFIDKKNKIKLAGGFHKLSDYDRKLPKLLKKNLLQNISQDFTKIGLFNILWTCR